jgi:hypothetical protein
MKHPIIAFVFVVSALAVPALAQTAQLPAPSPIEKELAARASNVTEVTLGKDMLGFAAKVMNDKDTNPSVNPLYNRDVEDTQKLIEGLDGIYVREYEFDKEGQFSAGEVEQLRKYFETSEWSPMVQERERKSGESTDVMVKLVNGESHGLFVLIVEPKELTIVLILGPIRMDELGKLNGVAGLSGALGPIAGALGPISAVHHSPNGKQEVKAKEKEKTGGNQ